MHHHADSEKIPARMKIKVVAFFARAPHDSVLVENEFFSLDEVLAGAGLVCAEERGIFDSRIYWMFEHDGSTVVCRHRFMYELQLPHNEEVVIITFLVLRK